MTMRLDIVSNDAGEMVRREHARDLGAGVVVAIYRLAKLAQMHNLSNQAFVQQLDSTHQIIGDYCLRSGGIVNILFAQRAVFVAGQLLKGSRQTYEQAQELAEICEWLGGSELVISREVTREELHAFAEQVSASMRSEKGTFQSPTQRIRLRAVADAARMRGLEIEDLGADQRIIRTYASAVVILRRFFEDLHSSRYILPRRIKRVAQSLVDLSDGNNASFLGVTEARNANHDEAGRAVNSAILAVTVARQVTQDRIILAQIAMASMMHDVARPRALALSQAAMAAMGAGGMGAMAPTLSEDQEDRLASGAAAVLTALGRVNEPSITRTVVAFEALWLRRQQWLGQLYRGVRAPTIHARIMFIARRYNDLMTPEPGLLPPTSDFGVAQLSAELSDPQDKTVLRMLVAAIGVIPLGTVVQLSTGEVGEVTRGTMGPDEKPLVRLSMDANGGVYNKQIDLDLARQTPGQAQRTVIRVLSIDGWKKSLDLRKEQEPLAHDGHGAAGYDEAPPWESVKPPPPEPRGAPTQQPSQQSYASHSSHSSQPSHGAPPERATSPVPRAPHIDFNADAFTVPPPAMPSSVPAGADGRATAPVPPPQKDNSSQEPISTSGVSNSLGTSPSMVGRMMGGWEDPPPPPNEGGQDERTLFQASARDAPVVERASASLRTPEPTARGDLASTPLAHVLVYMLDHALTGSVVFDDSGTDHVVYFVRGVPAKVKLGFDFAMLGELLARAGAFEESKVHHYVEGAGRLGVLLGEYLVGHDVVSRETLAWVLETQVLEKVSGLANLAPETTYAYYRDLNLLEQWGGDLSLSSPLNAVLAVVRAWNDRGRIRATLNRIGKHTLSFHEDSELSGLILSDEELAIIDTLRRERMQLHELFQRNVADEDVVSALIYTMAVTRQFAFKGQKKGPMATHGSAPRPRPEPQVKKPAPPPTAKKATGVSPNAHFANPPKGLNRPAPSPKAPITAPQMLPPTAPHPPPMAAPAASTANAPSSQRGVSLPKMGAGGARPVVKGTIQGLQPKALSQMLSGGSGSSGAAPASSQPGVSRSTASKVQVVTKPPTSLPKLPAAAPPARAPEKGSGSKVSVAKMPAAGSQKPGVPQIRPIAGGNASGAASVAKMAAAKAANAGGAPSMQRPVAPRLPSQMGVRAAPPPAIAPPPPESSPDVSDPSMPTTPPGPEAEDGTLALGDAGLGGEMEEAELAIEAMSNFRLADAALSRSDFAAAEALARKAVDGDPMQVEYRVLLTWVVASRVNTTGAFEGAAAEITTLLEEDPSNERAFLYRGRLYKKLGKKDLALADFEGVLDSNPTHREAQAEVRALKKK